MRPLELGTLRSEGPGEVRSWGTGVTGMRGTRMWGTLELEGCGEAGSWGYRDE